MSSRKWAEVSIGILECDKLVDKPLETGTQPLVTRGSHDLGRSRQVLAREFARPGKQVAVGHPVTIGEHGQDRRIGGGSR